jgi:hypothetical protein
LELWRFDLLWNGLGAEPTNAILGAGLTDVTMHEVRCKLSMVC